MLSSPCLHPVRRRLMLVYRMTEIVFEVREDEVSGGYTALAQGVGIQSKAETLEQLRASVKEAVNNYFDDPASGPQIIRLHFVRDEVFAR